MTSNDPRIRLVDHLDGLAAYNDKYFRWIEHSLNDVRMHQREAQAIIDTLIVTIGDRAFSPDLLSKLRSGAASTDASGEVSVQARTELLSSPNQRGNKAS